MRRMLCIGLSVWAAGCGQIYQPSEGTVEEEALPLQGGGTEGTAAERAPETCNCHGKPKSEPEVETVDMSQVDLASAPSRGSANAPVTLVVYCDFQCPFCRRAQSTLHALETKYESELRIVFKQRPLPMHDSARLAAKASLVALDQGRFWELHDLMLEEPHLGPETIETLAVRAGLDLTSFRSALESPDLERRLERELQDADRVGAKGTPTFFVNGKKIAGNQPAEVFEKAIDQALSR